MDVGVFVVDGVADFGLAAVGEVLGTANALRDEIESPPPPWRITTLGSSPSVRTGAGHTVRATVVDPRTYRPDLLIVPATNVKEAEGLIDTVTSPDHRGALDLIRGTRDRGVPLAAACTGTFFLAEAGALDGRTATTSWWLGPLFRKRYPSVHLDESRTLCRSDGVTTAGAAIAHVNLVLSLVQAVSPVLAERVARYLLIGDPRSQADFAIPSVLARADPVVTRFEEWVRGHLDATIQVPVVARALGLSERTLQRATASTLGVSPLDFITAIRVDHAAHLLRTTDLSTEAVAGRVGYVNASTLRGVVRRHRGVTIRELRAGPDPVA